MTQTTFHRARLALETAREALEAVIADQNAGYLDQTVPSMVALDHLEAAIRELAKPVMTPEEVRAESLRRLLPVFDALRPEILLLEETT